jgi:ArsR family transcriptional regulator
MAQVSIKTQSRTLGERCCVEPGDRRLRPSQADRLAEDLKLLADPARLQILDILASHPGKVCVCDLEAALPILQPTISHHLGLLRRSGLISVERKGLWAYYTINRSVLEARRAKLRAFLETL